MKYVTYYDTPDNKAERRGYQLSAANKIDYICRVLNRLGHDVLIVSASMTENRNGCKGKTVHLFDNTSLKLFPCMGMRSLPIRILRRILCRIRLLCELVFHTRRGENVLVYHSLAYAGTIALARRIKDFRLILEVEEIYADVTGNERDRHWENRLFEVADAFLFPTQLLNKKVNSRQKPYGIIHGTYHVETDRRANIFQDEKIHCVYAGTFDPRKGAPMAVAAAEFLPENYHIHVLGFGTEEEKQNMRNLIADISRRSSGTVSFDGQLSGEEYIRFVQSCQIGLSPQDPDAAFNGTSFPSKILSYLANGLRVVSIRIPAIEASAIGERVYFYDRQTPEEIAKAIQSIDVANSIDPRSLIETLDREFGQIMEGLLKYEQFLQHG